MQQMKTENTINEFIQMRNLAELKALSSYSLEHPLGNEQFKRMMELKQEVLK